jgi:hypothetical protein
MSGIMQCFSTEELESLTEHQLTLLRFAIEREVRNNPEIHRIIRERFQPMFERMVSQGTPTRARGSRSRRTPPAASE